MEIEINTDALAQGIKEDLAPENAFWSSSRTLLAKRGKYQIQLVVTRDEDDFLDDDQNKKLIKFRNTKGE